MEFLEPWFPIDTDEKISINNEFKKEVHPNHILYNKELELIGRRSDCDDILFSIIGTDNVAYVHLTWKYKQESGIYPTTHILSIQDFIKEMKLENEAW